MNSKKSIFFIIILLFFTFLLFYFNKNKEILKKPSENNIHYVKIAGKTLKVELALTPSAQAQGLSGRSTLAEDAGMLFAFDHPDKYSFWMKDMNFPIDMIWLGEDLQVVFIKKNVLPETYPNTFAPPKNAVYVLEVVSGFSNKNNLVEGDTAVFLP